MRTTTLIKFAIGATASLLLMSCGDPKVTTGRPDVHVYKGIKDFMGGAQVAVVEIPLTNSTEFFNWVKLYSCSTNLFAQGVQSDCDTIWVNMDFEAWRAASVGDSPSSIAVIGRYEINGLYRFAGTTFAGDRIVHLDGPPESGFVAYDLKMGVKP